LPIRWHVYATKSLERYQKLYGDRGLELGVYFNNGPGNIGRLDVLDNANGIIYDWKFGYPGMTPAQLNATAQMAKTFVCYPLWKLNKQPKKISKFKSSDLIIV
jgi:hypothetical protein